MMSQMLEHESQDFNLLALPSHGSEFVMLGPAADFSFGMVDSEA